MRFEDWLDRQILNLKEQNLFRAMPFRSEMRGLCFCSNDYLGLSAHEELKRAAAQAIVECGIGSSGSRLISGSWKPHEDLEQAVAGWLEKEAALVFNSGYHAGTGAIPALAGTGAIFSDELNHASLVDGCRLSKAKVFVYRHGDMDHLEKLLSENSDLFPRWIISESIFGMEGEKAPLQRLVELKQNREACLFLDEAHAIGIYGEKGRGLSEELNAAEEIDVIMGTFSKAFGSFGAFLSGKMEMMMFLRNKARSFIFSTALPPAIAEVNAAAVSMVARMGAERMRLRRKGEEVREFLRKNDFETRGEDCPIIPVIIGEPAETVRLSQSLLEEGIWVQPIRPPTVPAGSSRLRISLSTAHSEGDYQKLFEAFEKVRIGARRG